MNSLLSIGFWGSSIAFILLSVVLFFAPGAYLLQRVRLKLEPFAYMAVACALGMFLWGAQAYIGGYLGLRPLTYGYVLLSFVLAVSIRKEIGKTLRDCLKNLRSLPFYIVGMSVIGIVLQLFQIVGNGLVFADGIHLWRTHAYDGVFHIGLIENMVRSFPPQEPSAAGMLVANYHYWSDLIIAEMVRIFHFSSSQLFFQLFPLLIAVLTVLAVIGLLQTWKFSFSVIGFVLFFLLFGADAGYIVVYWVHKMIGFQYPVIDNGATQFLNFPHTIAKYVFISFVVLLDQFLKTKKLSIGLLMGLLGAFLFGLKVYFGLFAALGVCVLLLMFFLSFLIRKQKKETGFLKYFVVSVALFGCMALAIYIPPNKGAGGLDWYPLEWPKLLLSENHIDWREWRYKHAVAELDKNVPKLLYYDALAIIATILAIHGTRLIGFIVLPKHSTVLGKRFMVFFTIPTLVFTILGFYTLQRSGSFNVFNFFAVSMVPLSLFAGVTLATLIDRWKVIGTGIVIVIMLLTLPRIIFETVTTAARYKENTDMVRISNERLLAYEFVAKELSPSAVLQSAFTDEYDVKSTYLTAFGQRPVFFAGKYLLETHNQPFADREAAVERLFSSGSETELMSQAKSLGITHLFLSNAKTDRIREILTTGPIYTNDAVSIYEVK